MTVTGMYRIALNPGADEQAFITHMTTVAFQSGAIQPTRITAGIQHRLLRAQGSFRQFIWVVTLELVTDAGYDFGRNIESVQKSVAAFGVLTDVESCLDVAQG